jgi:hypothetical protein
MEYEKMIIGKYEKKLSQSFDLRLNYYLFQKLIQSGNFIGICDSDFLEFEINEVIINHFKAANKVFAGKARSSDKLTIEEIDKKIELWDKEYNEMEHELLAVYRNHFMESVYPLDDFKRLYPKEKSRRRCHYCGLSETQIEFLKNKNQIYTKSPTRGNSMEFDRFDSHYEYSKGNVVLACFWCNNAKTDEFSKKEFEEILGPAFRQIWLQRLTKEGFGNPENPF